MHCTYYLERKESRIMIRVLITDATTRRGGVGVGGWVMVGDMQQGKTHRRGRREDSVSHVSRNLFHRTEGRDGCVSRWS